MKLSSSNGTQLTIEQMGKAWSLLHECYLRIQEINDGTYSKDIEQIQFDYCTSPELSNWADKIEDISKKINKVVYQE